MEILSTIEVILETGLVFSILAMGYYVSYHILDFPDLTVEGTFLAGAVTFGILATNNINPWIAIICSFMVGSFFGTITGLIHVLLKIKPLLCGILVSTSLISLNLIATSVGITGDFTGQLSSSISYGRSTKTLHDFFFTNLIPSKINNISIRDLLIFLFIAFICKYLLDFYFKTKSGLLLRAVGNNQQYVISLGQNAGKYKVIGLAIGNGYAAISGALYTHISGNVNQSMGIGTVVIGLASLIIGISLFKSFKFINFTSKVILGSICYQACLAVAQKLGLPSAYNKFLMAIMFTLALIISSNEKREKYNAVKTK